MLDWSQLPSTLRPANPAWSTIAARAPLGLLPITLGTFLVGGPDGAAVVAGAAVVTTGGAVVGVVAITGAAVVGVVVRGLTKGQK